jgi:hypothetical protein
MTSVGGILSINENPALAQCLADDLVGQIQALGGVAGEISFCEGFGSSCEGITNNESCTCSEVGGVLAADCP